MAKKPSSTAAGIAIRSVPIPGAAVLLFCATLCAYMPALNGGLLWDDNGHITRPDLQSMHGLWRIWFDLGATQQYYPLLHSAFWIEHRLWGNAVLGYHLTNVVLHVASACLLTAILRRLAVPGAWLAGAIFALHPVCVGSVAWISEQKNTLSTFFYLTSGLMYLRFDHSRRRLHYFVALALFLFAMLSKTVTATLPAGLLVVFWWQRGVLHWKRDILPLVPWLALGAAAGLFTAWVERTMIGARGPAFGLSTASHFLLAGRVIWFYLGKLVWPSNLLFVYQHWTINSSQWWQYLYPAGVLVLGAVLWMLRRHRGPLAGFLFFVGTLFPVLGFLNVYPFVYSYVADHFQYLATLGVIVPVASGLTLATTEIRAARVLNLVLPLTLGIVTWNQSAVYQNGEVLYRHTIAHNPESWMAHNNLGNLLATIPGRLSEAIGEYETALRIKPDLPAAEAGLGFALSKSPGMLPADAIAHLQASLRLNPDSAETHYSLAVLLSDLPDKWSDAIGEYRAALKINPDLVEAHNNLGSVLSRMPGKSSEAIHEYQEALRIDPGSAQSHINLGILLAEVPGRISEAIANYEEALRIDPQSEEAESDLGLELSRIPGRLPEAIRHLEAAVRLAPDSAETHYNLGIVLSTIPDQLSEAITQYQEALRINPNSAELHASLGIALAKMPGRSAEAASQLRAALQLQPDLAPARELLNRLR